MDPPQSCASSIIVSDSDDPSAGTGVAEPSQAPPHIPHDLGTPGSAWLTVERDNIFYFETVVFQVEDTLFRVLKSGFQVEGSPFEAIFSLLHTPGEIFEGVDDSNPIYLHGISKNNFRSFLRVLYPFKGAPTTYVEWIAALDLAIMWGFGEIRKRCIEALSELMKSRSVFGNILLARKYRVKKWLRAGYIQLVQQKGALELGGDIRTAALDALTLARLLYIRERKHCELQGGASCRTCKRKADDYSFSSDDANKKIDEVFADEISGMHED